MFQWRNGRAYLLFALVFAALAVYSVSYIFPTTAIVQPATPNVPEPDASPALPDSPSSSETLVAPAVMTTREPESNEERRSRDRRTEKKEEKLSDVLLRPLIAEAILRREVRAKNNPDYLHRIDAELGRGRLNVLIFTSGETHEPPLDWAIIASPSIISIDYVNGAIDTVSLTHDIRAPEVAEVLGIKGQPRSAQRIDQALLNDKVGGFDLTRRVLENATGLSMDFQIHSNDTAIQKLVDNVFHGVTVYVPIRMELGAYYYKRVKYDEGGRVYFPGKHTMDGRSLVGFIKAIPTVGPKDESYSPLMEHNVRKALVFEAIQNSVKTKWSAQFLFEVMTYAVDVISSKDVTYDFDHNDLIVRNIGNIVPEVAESVLTGRKLQTELPALRKQIYIVDLCCSTDPGNMPVHWANWIGPGEEIIRQDWKNGVFQEGLGYQVPYGANPYGDLVTEYWQRVRAYVRKSLLGKQ